MAGKPGVSQDSQGCMTYYYMRGKCRKELNIILYIVINSKTLAILEHPVLVWVSTTQPWLNPGSTLAQSINDTKGTAHAHEAQATGALPAEANLSHSHQACDTTNGMAGGPPEKRQSPVAQTARVLAGTGPRKKAKC